MKPFDARALRQIFRHARGVPRRINLLCDRALLGAYAQGRMSVDASVVDRAAREVFDEAPTPRIRPALAWGLGAAAVLLVAAGAWWFAGPETSPDRLAQTAPVPDQVGLATPAAPSKTQSEVTPTPRSPAPAGIDSAVAGPDDGGAAATASAPPRVDADGLTQRPGWPDEASAWRALAARWGLAPDGPDPCATLATAGVACYRAPATLALIRQLDRPGWLAWQTSPGVQVPLLLTGLGVRGAVLQTPDGPVSVSLSTLASRWNGEFATLWREPPSPRGPWLQERLAAEQAGVLPPDAPLRTRVEAFQRAQGLGVDGLVGPLTVMQLNRVADIAEPRLTAER